MRRTVAFVLLFGFAVAFFLSLSARLPVSVRNRLDFLSFYTAGRIVKEGLGSKLYDYDTQLAVQREFGHDEPLLYVHPPFEALMFLPFAYLPYWGAYLLWGVFDLAVLTIVSFLLWPYVKRFDTGSKLVLAAVMFFPIAFAVGKGQDSMLLVLAYVLAFLNLRKNRDLPAGYALGMGLFRFQLVLPLLIVFVVRRRWKVILGALAVGGLFALASLLLVGWGGCLSYCNLLLDISGKANRNLAYIPQTDMPTLRGFAYLVLAGKLRARYLGVLIAFCSAALLWWLVRRWSEFEDSKDGSFDLLFSLSTVVSTLVAYHLLLHDLVLLILPASIVLNHCAQAAAVRGNAWWGLSKPLLVAPLAGFFLTELGLITTGAWRFLSVSFCFLLFFALSISREIAAAGKGTSRRSEQTSVTREGREGKVSKE